MIQVRDLVKEYRSTQRREGLLGAVQDLFGARTAVRRAVDSISFDIAPGETVGYIGANGAGKSTTIKMLTGILAPTSGSVRALGMDPLVDRRRYVHRIGVVFGQRTQLWWDIAVIEAYRLLGRIYQLPEATVRERIARFSQVLDLEPLLHQPVRKLSLGQRMRCDLAAALLHAPELVFLDEPTIGLDVDVKEHVRNFVRAVNREQGTTVLLTTHDLRDVEELCRRVLLIDQGRILFDGALADFRKRFARERRAILDVARAEDLPALQQVLVGLPVVIEVQAPTRILVRFDPETVPTADLVARALRGPSLQDLSVQEADLSDIVRDVYRSRPATPGRPATP